MLVKILFRVISSLRSFGSHPCLLISGCAVCELNLSVFGFLYFAVWTVELDLSDRNMVLQSQVDLK